MALFTKKNKTDDSYYLASQWTLMGRKLKKHKLAKLSMWLLGILYTIALLAGFLAPYGLDEYDSRYKNSAPSKIHFMYKGEFIGPYVFKMDSILNKDTFKKEFKEDISEPFKIKFLAEGSEYKLLGIFQTNVHLFGVEEGINGGSGARVQLFGADSLGNDLFSRIILGSRISLTVPFASAIISFILGILLGGISGYFGGWIDTFIQRIIEVIEAIPSIPLWMALSVAIPANVSVVSRYLYITIILSFIGWCGLARVVRGKFISLRKEDYVMAARLAGVSDFKIITKHLIPGFLSYLIVSITLGIPGSIIGETSMSFLGLGLRAPATSWGVLLKETQDITSIAQYPWKLIALAPVIVTVLAFNFFGDGLRDAADPYK